MQFLEIHAEYHRQDLLDEATHERLIAQAMQPRLVRPTLRRTASRIVAWIAASAPRRTPGARRGRTCRLTENAAEATNAERRPGGPSDDASHHTGEWALGRLSNRA